MSRKIPDEVLDCPNFGYPRSTLGRNGHSVIGVGLHVTGSDNWEESTKDYLMRYGTNASYNYVIRASGWIIQLVPPENAAYSHGGIRDATWPLLKSGVNPNLYTASIARTGSGRRYTYPQWISTWDLIYHLADLCGFPVKEPNIFGHFMITTRRWYCPGVEFWDSIERKLGKLNEQEKPEDTRLYRVFGGSFKNLEYAKRREHDISKLSPVLEPEIVYNKFLDRYFYRVLVAEHVKVDQAQKAVEWLEEHGYQGFITGGKEVDLPFPGEEEDEEEEEKDDKNEIVRLLQILKEVVQRLLDFFRK